MTRMPDLPGIPEKIVIQVMVETKTGQVYVSGPLHLKAMCLHAMADAIHTITEWKPSVIQAPSNGNKPHITQ